MPSICAWRKRCCSRPRSRWTRRRWQHRCRRARPDALLGRASTIYENRGVNLVCVAEKWQFRTAPDLAFLLRKEQPEQKRLSRAAIETLAIVAYHQPVTRAEIEDIRGVMLSKGTIDALMEVGWVKIRGRKRTPGRPVTYGTTEAFLVHFGLENVAICRAPTN
jgi:segregation and condensation protein B